MNIDIIFKIAAVGIITAIVNQLLKKADKDEIATLCTLAGLTIVILMVVSMISELFTTIKSLFQLFKFMPRLKILQNIALNFL